MSIPGNGIDPSTAIGLILRATFLLGVVGLAQRIARGRVSAATRHEAWSLTLAALLLLPALGATLPRWPIGIELGAWSTPAEAHPAPRAADHSVFASPDIRTIDPAPIAPSLLAWPYATI